jgi:hypothetical protein
MGGDVTVHEKHAMEEGASVENLQLHAEGELLTEERLVKRSPVGEECHEA